MKDEKELLCWCRTEYDDSKFYISCDYCHGWFHGACVGVTPKDAKNIAKYKCYACQSADLKVDEAYRHKSKLELSEIVKDQEKELKEKSYMKNEINNLKQSLKSSNKNLTKRLSASNQCPELKQQIETLTSHQKVLRDTITSKEETIKTLTLLAIKRTRLRSKRDSSRAAKISIHSEM